MEPTIARAEVERLENIYLPKWPQMLVWGNPVTQSQAKDIILRTDRFMCDVDNFPDGHNRKWIEWAQSELGFRHLATDKSPGGAQRRQHAQAVLRQGLGVISTYYVHNTWASSSFGHGPYGWCHPNGTIWYEHNIGKDPSACEVFEEWQALAAAFPFVDATITLFSGERLDEEKVPVVSFRVRDGVVHLLAEAVVPRERPVPPLKSRGPFATFEDELAASNGLPDDWIHEYGQATRKLLASFESQVCRQSAL